MTFVIPEADLGANDHFNIVVNLTGSGPVYESTGATAMDFVRLEYHFGAGAPVHTGELLGNDINNGSLNTGSIAIGSGDLTVVLSLQNWANDEDIFINECDGQCIHVVAC